MTKGKSGSMWDRNFLPKADFEFVVIADTHYMIDPAGQAVEFASRRRQTERAAYALQAVAALEVPLVIHMGDLVQEFPERPTFAQAVAEATTQLGHYRVEPHFVAGNHDVGDKPDPTMPASWVTPAFLAEYHQRVGRSWYSWDQGGYHFVVLNSQIMNSTLPAATEQQQWLVADLARHADRRIVLALHLPPYLYHPAEPALGHYDNLDQPARAWLLDLVQQYRVELLFAAHVHWAFYNELGATRAYTVPSSAFTRPGFSELFASPPPPEQGRDDTGKLGFFLVRVQPEGTRVHFLRTGGATEQTALDTPRLLTRLSADLPASPLGVVLHHPLTNVAQTPSAWPSTIRQPVRNDYPLLSALELGLRHVRVPASDLADPLQAERLAILRRAGVQLTAGWLWQEGLPLAQAVNQRRAHLDSVLVETLGSPWPSAGCLAAIAECRRTTGAPVTLAPVVPGRAITGKQHGRSQRGYTLAELPRLAEQLAAAGVRIDRVLCRIERQEDPWAVLGQAALSPCRPLALDSILELTSDRPQSSGDGALCPGGPPP
ncbi:MAG: metallophosphoesterase [Caldilineaceae bacterium]